MFIALAHPNRCFQALGFWNVAKTLNDKFRFFFFFWKRIISWVTLCFYKLDKLFLICSSERAEELRKVDIPRSLLWVLRLNLGKVKQKMEGVRKPRGAAESTNAVWTVAQLWTDCTGRGWEMEGTKGSGRWMDSQAKAKGNVANGLYSVMYWKRNSTDLTPLEPLDSKTRASLTSSCNIVI